MAIDHDYLARKRDDGSVAKHFLTGLAHSFDCYAGNVERANAHARMQRVRSSRSEVFRRRYGFDREGR